MLYLRWPDKNETKSGKWKEKSERQDSSFSLLPFTLIVLHSHSLIMPLSALAQGQPQCVLPGSVVQNRASFTYSDSVNPQPINGQSNSVATGLVTAGQISIAPGGVEDGNDNLVVGAFAGALADELMKLGFTQEEATKAVIAAIVALSSQPTNSSFDKLATLIKDAVVDAVPTRANTIEGLQRSAALETGVSVVANLVKNRLIAAGLTEAEAEATTQAAIGVLSKSTRTTPVNQAFETAFQAMVGVVPSKAETLTQLREDFIREMDTLRAGISTGIRQGDVLYFEFVISNPIIFLLSFQV